MSVLNKKRNSFTKIFTNALFLVITLPIFVYGWLNNLLAYFPAVYFSKKMKDPQFISTIKYGIGMVTFPLFYLIQTILVEVFFSEPYITLGYLVSLPLTGYFAYFYNKIFKKLKKELRILKVKRDKPEVYKRILILKEQIINKMDSWVNQIGISE